MGMRFGNALAIHRQSQDQAMTFIKRDVDALGYVAKKGNTWRACVYARECGGTQGGASRSSHELATLDLAWSASNGQPKSQGPVQAAYKMTAARAARTVILHTAVLVSRPHAR